MADFITERINNPRLGLPVTARVRGQPVHPTFQLDGIATAGVGVGFGGPYGTGAGGGVAFQFGDELEDHILAATVEASGQIQAVGGQAVYLNQTHRWNYGVAVSHLPFLQLGEAAFDTTIVSSNGTKNTGQLLNEEYLYTYYESVNAFAYYPLSYTRRIELGAGFTYLHYGLRADQYLETNSGQTISSGNKCRCPPHLGSAWPRRRWPTSPTTRASASPRGAADASASRSIRPSAS